MPAPTPEQQLYAARGEAWPPLLVYVDGRAARGPVHGPIVGWSFEHVVAPAVVVQDDKETAVVVHWSAAGCGEFA